MPAWKAMYRERAEVKLVDFKILLYKTHSFGYAEPGYCLWVLDYLKDQVSTSKYSRLQRHILAITKGMKLVKSD